MKTVVANTETIIRKWYVIDAEEKVLGRLVSEIALLLMGKGKPLYSPNQDHGDYIVVINTDKVRLTGKKAETKNYFRHSQYPSGGKTRSFKEQMEQDSTKVLRDAVHGMLPKTVLGRDIIRKLFPYSGSEHPHTAQKPEVLSI